MSRMKKALLIRRRAPGGTGAVHRLCPPVHHPEQGRGSGQEELWPHPRHQGVVDQPLHLDGGSPRHQPERKREQCRLFRLYECPGEGKPVFRLPPWPRWSRRWISWRRTSISSGSTATTYNFSDFIPKEKVKKDEKPARFSLNNIWLKQGTIDVTDRLLPREQQHTVRKLEVRVPFVSSLPYLADTYITPGMSAVANGSPFSAGGENQAVRQAGRGPDRGEVQGTRPPLVCRVPPGNRADHGSSRVN